MENQGLRTARILCQKGYSLSVIKKEAFCRMYACYCRVSSRRQKNDSQRAEIQRWLANHHIKASSVRWFEDCESGKSLQRTAFQALQRAIFNGDVKTVVVWNWTAYRAASMKGLLCWQNGVNEAYA